MIYLLLKSAVFLLMIAAIGVAEIVFFYRDKPPACEEMPIRTIKEVQQIVEDHAITRQQIENVRPKYISLTVDDYRCPGRAEILIYYATEGDRRKIKKIIGNTFFGVPYRMFNV